MTSSIPSPPVEWAAFHVGPLTIHAYALWIMLGIVVAVWLTTRRWKERGGEPDAVMDIVFWAVPFGIVGGRIYHVISSPAAYFGEGGNPWAAFRIWEGGLGIWGAVALGALGAWIGARRAGVSFATFADAAAPGVLLAQAIGRLGNYFNQELFGRPTDLPWGLEIDPAFRPPGFEEFATFHPTFLYEMLWNIAGVVLILWLDRRLDLRGGRVFWLYVMVYVAGRAWIEGVRIDEAVTVGGLRINEWVSIAVLTLAVSAFTILGVRQRSVAPRPDRSQLAAVSPHPGKEEHSESTSPSVTTDDASTDEYSDEAAGETTDESSLGASDEARA